jgi:hypothetical protein
LIDLRDRILGSLSGRHVWPSGSPHDPPPFAPICGPGSGGMGKGPNGILICYSSSPPRANLAIHGTVLTPLQVTAQPCGLLRSEIIPLGACAGHHHHPVIFPEWGAAAACPPGDLLLFASGAGPDTERGLSVKSKSRVRGK